MWVVKIANSAHVQSAAIGYMCMWHNCSKMYESLIDLEKHLNEHIELSIQLFRQNLALTCQVRGCEIAVNGTEELVRHIRMHIFHAEKLYNGLVYISNQTNEPITRCNFLPSLRIVYQGDALVCEWNDCRCSFADITEYVLHLGEHISSLTSNDRDDTGMFCCQWELSTSPCQMKFKTRDALRIHFQSHSGDKLCACPFCGSFFCSKQKLMDHIMRRQKGSEEHLCTFCRRTFKTQRLLESHCRKHIKTHKCPQCSLAVSSSWDLNRHIDSVHIRVKNYACDHCSKTFFQKSDLTKHVEFHFRGTTFKCSKCDKTYRWEKQFKKHMLIHDDPAYIRNPYTCQLCDSKFCRGALLTKHLVNVHKLSVPLGFLRFVYKKCSDGLYRLQTRQCFDKDLAQQLGLSSDANGSNVVVIA